MNFEIFPDDTAVTCLNRLLRSGDYKEPMAQYLAQIHMRFDPSMTGGGGSTAGVPEAPTDGNLYGRENAAWAVVPTGGGGGGAAGLDPKVVWTIDDFEADIGTGLIGGDGTIHLGRWRTNSSPTLPASVSASSAHENGIWQITSQDLVGGAAGPGNAPILLGNQIFSLRWRARIPTLESNAAANYTYCFGALSGNGIGGSQGEIDFGYDSFHNGPNWIIRCNAGMPDTGVPVNPAYWYDLIVVADLTNVTFSIGTNNAAPVQVYQTTVASLSMAGKALHPRCSGYNYDSGNHVYLVDCYEEKVVWPANRMLL